MRTKFSRVVKALDLKSNGVSPRRFESCRLRNHFDMFFNVLYYSFFFRVSNRKQKISLDCPDYAKTNTWYRHKNKSPSPPKSEPNRGSQKRYFIVSIAIIAYTHMHMSSKIKIIMYKIGPLR